MSMTLEQAIRILHPDTCTEALNEIDDEIDARKIFDKATILACEVMQREVERRNELTRCKDCAGWDKSISFMGGHACSKWSPNRENPRYTQEYDFCSMAIRKPLNDGKVD